MNDIRIDKMFKMNEGIEAWYYNDEPNQDKFQVQRKNFVDNLNKMIQRANTQRKFNSSAVTQLYEDIEYTASMFCYGGLQLNKPRTKVNEKMFNDKWKQKIPPMIKPDMNKFLKKLNERHGR